MQEWQCKIAASLGGGFAGTPNQVWGTKEYKNDTDPTVFFGCYGLPDFMAVRNHKGRKAILWAGSDIRHFINGYWIDEKGGIRIDPYPLARYLDTCCENWVENEVERQALLRMGIESKVCPSFLGNVEDYKVSFKAGNKLYTSVSGDDFEVYGWDKIERIAQVNTDIEFYLYGNTKPFSVNSPNVFVRGRMSQEEMDREIRGMQGALRLAEFEGFSEIVAKSMLWGQWPVSAIEYPYALRVSQLGEIKNIKTPNKESREHYLRVLNNYPWNKYVKSNN